MDTDYWVDLPPDLAFDVPGAHSLCQVLAHRALNQGQDLFCTVIERTGEQGLSFGQLRDRALRAGAALRECGLRPGDRVALILPTGIDFLLAYFGAQLAGLVPSAIAPPFMPRNRDYYVQDKCAMLNGIGAAALVTTADHHQIAHAIRAGVPGMRAVLTADQLDVDAAKGSGATDHAVKPGDIAMIQFSSGSNGRQKGVALTHAGIMANLRSQHLAMGTTRKDVFVSWLPLYHDMGLLGCVSQALFAGCQLVLMSPTLFIASPLAWLRAMHEKGGTIGVAPNFGYQLCVDRIGEPESARLDLSRWRLALNGAEMVLEQTLDQFVARFGPLGFRRQTFMPVYGLAEATLAVCFTPPQTGPIVDRVRRCPLAARGVAEPCGRAEAGVAVVSVGRPVPGMQVRIVDGAGREVAERVQGRVLIRSASVMAGYYNDPAATDETLRDGWLDTGDMAYRAGENFVLTGRYKDVIIKAGRNYMPELFEQAAALVPGVRKNAVAAFGVALAGKGTETIVVMAETKLRDEAERAELIRAVRHAVSRRLEMTPDEVVLVPPRTIPKTTSGKVQRPLCRKMYLETR